MARRLDLSPQPFPLTLAGGAVNGQRGYRERIISELIRRRLQPGPVTTVEEPVRGAVSMARAMCKNGEGSDPT